ncbi:protein of unknown function [Pseudomonas mediterranea]
MPVSDELIDGRYREQARSHKGYGEI